MFPSRRPIYWANTLQKIKLPEFKRIMEKFVSMLPVVDALSFARLNTTSLSIKNPAHVITYKYDVYFVVAYNDVICKQVIISKLTKASNDSTSISV